MKDKKKVSYKYTLKDFPHVLKLILLNWLKWFIILLPFFYIYYLLTNTLK